MNDTYALTGLPGRVKIGVRSGPSMPKPCGIPGCMATLRNVIVPSLDRAALTTSCSPPMLTPPLVISRSASLSRPSRRAEHHGRVVAEPVPPDDRAGLPGGRGQHEAVGFPDLAGDQRSARLDQLVAGRDDRDPGRRAGQHLALPGRGQQGQLHRADQGARRAAARSPSATSSPRWRTALPRLGACADGDTARCRRRSTPPGPRRRRPRAAAAPVMIRRQVPGVDPVVAGVAGGDLAAHRQRDRRVGAGPGQVGGLHRVAVHGRVVERRQRRRWP